MCAVTVAGKGFTEVARGTAIESEQHATRRAPVEAINRIHEHSDGVANLLQQRVIVVGPATVHSDSCGFVDYRHTLIGPQDTHACNVARNLPQGELVRDHYFYERT